MLLNGNPDGSTDLVKDGLNKTMATAIQARLELGTLEDILATKQAEQDNIEADFILAMGDMLKDGYWSNQNYTVDQVQGLYSDAKEISKQMAKPEVKYSVSINSICGQIGYRPDQLKINTAVRIYDPDLGLNDIVHVEKITRHLDNSASDTVEISNKTIDVGGMTFQTIVSRMAQLSTLLEEKNSVYERASNITASGTLMSHKIEGQINVLANQLSSVTSNWYTDEQGNQVFESSDGESAMMLTGAGFMIAGKTYGTNPDGSPNTNVVITEARRPDGSWNWRTFGTGNGFTADMITSGYLSAARIEANSITANKLASDVGSSLDLSSNTSINLSVGSNLRNQMDSILDARDSDLLDSVDAKISAYDSDFQAKVDDIIQDYDWTQIVVSATEPTSKKDGLLWLDTSKNDSTSNLLKRWIAASNTWELCSIKNEDLTALYNTISSEYQSAIAGLDFTQIVVSDQEPSNPKNGLLWLNTSAEGGNGKVLKRYVASSDEWVIVNVTQNDLNTLETNITNAYRQAIQA